MNKADLIQQKKILEKAEYLGLNEGKRWVSVSAKTGQNTKQLKELIKNILESLQKPKVIKKTVKGELEKIYGN